MALTYPLSLASFHDMLAFASVRFELMRQDEVSGLASGEILAAELSPPLWTAQVSLDPMPIAEAASVLALIEALDGPIQTFFLANAAHDHPFADPDGSALGLSEPEILSVGSGGGAMALAGLPEGYALTPGDFLAFDHGSSPARRAFHRIVEAAIADGSGETAQFTVRPHLPAAAAEIAVTLIRPAAKMAMVPGSINHGQTAGVMTRGIGFTAREKR